MKQKTIVLKRKKYKYKQELRVGIIQTTVDCNVAWIDSATGKEIEKMNAFSEKQVLDELRKGFNDLEDMIDKPHIVLIPEYSIPHGGLSLVERFARQMGVVVFGGMDLWHVKRGLVANRGIIVIPDGWPDCSYSRRCHIKQFGKTHFAEDELDWFDALGVSPVPETINYIINAGEYGVIGIAICSDFYDLERFILYRGKIHHLFIIAYNKDYRSFEALAEAISRLLFCNVVICNTGHYGDSLAFSPYRKEYKRTIYKNMGARLFSTQVVTLPTFQLDFEQSEAHKRFQENKKINSKDSHYKFKWAPGYKKHLFGENL